MVKTVKTATPESVRISLLRSNLVKVWSGLIFLFRSKLWYIASKSELSGALILKLLANCFLVLTKAGRVLILALIKPLVIVTSLVFISLNRLVDR